MTDATQIAERPTVDVGRPEKKPDLGKARLRKRYRADRRLRAYGILAIAMAILFLIIFLSTVVIKGYSAFTYTTIGLDVTLAEDEIDPVGTRQADTLVRANYQGLLYDALYEIFPDVSGRSQRKALRGLISPNAGESLREEVLENPALIGQDIRVWVTASDDVDVFVKGQISREVPQSNRRIKDNEIAFIDDLKAIGRIETRLNIPFFTNSNSSEPEEAGILGAIAGSLLTLFVCFIISFPLGVLAAVYLEEFASKSRFTNLIEVNINNLAAVPSIIFGLLGLALFLNVFGLPRSAPLVGGMVLALMTLPTIIITSRAALKSIPPSIQEAAFGIGASRVQVVMHHVLPLAMPGMLTGTIIGMAQALGETAPLLMIGMVAFIVDVPTSFTDSSTVLPVQIYLWADSPERAFVTKTYAAIIVLLVFLITMNTFAVFLRKKFERRW